MSETTEERFWRNVSVQPEGCWDWFGCKNRDGYGVLTSTKNEKADLSNRVSWKLHYGQIPRGMCVLHKCDNPSCCRPDHLFLGTHHDNQMDKVRKGRHAKGEQVGTSKLNEEQVRYIRSKHGQMKLRELAEMFRVDMTLISLIQLGKAWKHIPMEKNENSSF